MSSLESLKMLDQYALVILPALVVAEQFGIPLPAVPALLGVGALAAHGRGSIPLTLSAMAVVALTVDLAWYEFGRRHGARVLVGLCRLSLEPDFCVRRAQNVFGRYGARAMILAKFLPGVTTVLPPLAGIFAVGRVRFALYEVAGVLLWAGTWIGVGYVFSDAVTVIAVRVGALGVRLAVVVAALLGGYILTKYVRRRLYLRQLRAATISPEELKRRLDAGEDVTIVDLRTPFEVAAMPHAIPGSRWIEDDALDQREAEFLRGRELVLYCSCPNQATSARVALQLKRQGITRVHPLEGGLLGWMALGFPVEDRRPSDPAAFSPALSSSPHLHQADGDQRE